MNSDEAKAMMKTHIEEFTLTPFLRMNDETRERFNRLHLNLAAFIEHLTLGLLALKNMEECEIERVLNFGLRRNVFFACAYIQVKWKETFSTPACVEWISYLNFKSGLLLNDWINAPEQANHWVRQALAEEPLVVLGGSSTGHDEMQTGARGDGASYSALELEITDLEGLEEGELPVVQEDVRINTLDYDQGSD